MSSYSDALEQSHTRDLLCLDAASAIYRSMILRETRQRFLCEMGAGGADLTMLEHRAQNWPAQFARMPIAIVERLLDVVPDAIFFAKDADLRYVAANRAMLELCGVATREALIGRSSGDFFADDVRVRYESIDRWVMRTGVALVGSLGLSTPKRGRQSWLLCTHWPIHNERGGVAGATGIAVRLGARGRRGEICGRVARAVESMRQNLDQELSLDALAGLAGVSASQLARDFSKFFGVSPRQYQVRLKMQAALDLLERMPLAQVAQECGYSDQSAFARQFRKVVGLSPARYLRERGCARY